MAKKISFAQRFGKWKSRNPVTMDEQMHKLRRNMRVMLILFASAFVGLLGYFTYSVAVNGARWFESPYNTRLASEKTRIIAGSILDRDGNTLAETPQGRKGERNYVLGHHAAHLVGYDHIKFGRSGAEALFYRRLLGLDRSLYERVMQTISGQEERGDDVLLTIDAQLQKAASQAFDSSGLQGAAVLLDANTGEILAMVSKPDFDPSKLDQLWESESNNPSGEGVLVNRATQGLYPPGSTFKIITASAALQYLPGATTRTYTCTGEIEIGGGLVTCYKKAKHGEMTLEKALANSCNTFFASVALELGGARLQAEAERWGFNNDFLFSDIRVGLSSYTQPGDENALAWSAMGQDKDLATPLHMAMIAAAVANDGVMMEPKLLFEVKSGTGRSIQTLQSRQFSRVADNTLWMRQAMEACVKSGTATKLVTSKLKQYVLGGKTGTAEKMSANGMVNESWFIGYCVTSTRTLALAVVVEDTTKAASSVAVPLAATIFEKAISEIK